jgi:arylsulfatase
LDALANEGKILTNYHTAPTCSPARVSLLTGVDWHIGGIGTMYELIAQNQIGKPGYETYINNKVVTVAELLKDAGYHTLMSGKWHLSGHGNEHPDSNPYARGFDHVFSLLGDGGNHWNSEGIFPGLTSIYVENNTVVDRPGNNTLFSNNLYTDKMIQNINNTRGDGKPLFMYLAFTAAHSPFMVPPGNVEKYEKIYSAGWEPLREQRFEKQKELDIWPANMTLPKRLPPNQPWDTLTQAQQNYVSAILAVRAAMIEDTDKNIGRLIQHLKQIGEYDNTLIIFTSDNAGSEPIQFPVGGVVSNAVNKKELPSWFKTLNNTIPNIGNSTSSVNYGAWGSYLSVAPLSGFKTGTYEGGIRPPFIIKEPSTTSTAATGSSSALPAVTNITNTTNATASNVIKSFAFVTDMTPTILDYAKVSQPPAGSTYKGNQTHPIMGKSIKPLLNGTVDRVHGLEEPIGVEMFNSSALFMGDWVAIWDGAHPTGKWQLYNYVNDPAQNNNLADQNPDQLQKMVSAYQEYSKEVGIIIPRGSLFALQVSHLTPSLNQNQTVNLAMLLPEQAINALAQVANGTYAADV